MALSTDIKDLINRARNQRSLAYLTSESLPISFQIKLLQINHDHLLLENTIPPKYIRQFLLGKFFVFQIEMIRLQAKILSSDGKNIIFHLDEKSIIEDIRQTERFPFSVEEKVVCEILNPYDATTKIRKTVLDMSAFGLSLRTNYDSAIFKPQTNFSELKILIDGEIYKKTAGSVVYKRKLMNLNGHMRLQIGIKFNTK